MVKLLNLELVAINIQFTKLESEIPITEKVKVVAIGSSIIQLLQNQYY
jgi:hypothetical protein